jgi:glyoxylase-like metal-dependent hydrolase (beta-lactamase superfamily II)
MAFMKVIKGVNMKFKIVTLLVMSSLYANVLQAHNNKDLTEQSIVESIRSHYEFSKPLNKFSISYEELKPIAFQSYHYKKPDLIKSTYLFDFDIEKKQFYVNEQSYYPGGFIFDNVYFSEKLHTLYYDINGFEQGKQVLKFDAQMNDFKESMIGVADFLVVDKLLEEVSTKKIKVTFKKNNQAIIQVPQKDNMFVRYIFNTHPIELKSVYFSKKNATFTYNDFVKSNGITYASKVDYLVKNVLNKQFIINNVKPINKIEKSKLLLPSGYGPIINEEDKPLEFIKIAKDLYLINHVSGDRHVLVKENHDGLMVFGAPISDKTSNKVISFINKNIPEKTIKSVYITHAHSDHMRGLTAYAKKNITILADEYSIEAIKAYPKFKGEIAQFKFQTIVNKQLINGVRFYIPKNSHSKGQSFAYFEQSEIIYEGDFLEVPFDNTVATHMSQVEKEFVEFVRKEKLKIKRIVGHHRNNNITLSHMNRYYLANTPKTKSNL